MTQRVAIITGAGQGIGRAVAHNLAAQGVHPVLVGRTKAKLDQVAAELPMATVAAADVTDAAQVAACIKTVQDTFGCADILVNSAGEAFLADLEHTTDADWDRVLAINLKGAFLMARGLLPLLRKSENASIINIASKVALHGYGEVTAYSAAKAGLVGFTRSLAKELREEEIRVVALCPGPVDTPMRWAATPDFDRKVVISAETVAQYVSYVVNLPRGTTMSELLVESMHYD
ncbi:MAG: SDR family oxidoreductase [Anaerolineae bacterium]|nr:SDR family oxidoreductase [Anaerolineae bacterium]